ncbi:MAG TPA: anti-sigma factor [Planctomycetota bacterium]|nr:anti-sigma factor [Planctomycetota bacterium]
MGGKPNRILTVVAIALAGGGAVYLWAINLAIARDGDRRRIDELHAELMATRDTLRQAEGDFAFLGGASVSLLKSNDRLPAAKGAGGVVLHRGSSLFVAARHLPAPPKGKVFTLWAYFNGKPVPAGEFQAAPDGSVRGRHTHSRDLGTVEGFALSLEIPGNGGAPAGPVFLTRP